MRRRGAAPLALLLVESPPWNRQPGWLRDIVRVLGRARDFTSARWVFERAPRPRHECVWEAMLEVCNLCGEPGCASEVLSESVSLGNLDGA